MTIRPAGALLGQLKPLAEGAPSEGAADAEGPEATDGSGTETVAAPGDGA